MGWVLLKLRALEDEQGSNEREIDARPQIFVQIAWSPCALVTGANGVSYGIGEGIVDEVKEVEV